jgi:hypothetical protein
MLPTLSESVKIFILPILLQSVGIFLLPILLESTFQNIYIFDIVTVYLSDYLYYRYC